MADRALRETEMEIDRPLVAANPTVHEIPKCTFYRHHRNLDIFAPIQNGRNGVSEKDSGKFAVKNIKLVWRVK